MMTIPGKPAIYNAVQWITGAMRARQVVINTYLQPKRGDMILDIGCGTGYVMDYLDGCHYVGFDTDAARIAYARRKRGQRGDFHCGPATQERLEGYGFFDAVMMNGLLHHLGDAEAVDILQTAKSVLKPRGRVVGIDGCFDDRLGWFRRRILSMDQGKWIRDRSGYESLLLKVFTDVSTEVRADLFFIPYCCLLWKCTHDG
jgi:SAM-dependent methyltransferase